MEAICAGKTITHCCAVALVLLAFSLCLSGRNGRERQYQQMSVSRSLAEVIASQAAKFRYGDGVGPIKVAHEYTTGYVFSIALENGFRYLSVSKCGGRLDWNVTREHEK